MNNERNQIIFFLSLVAALCIFTSCATRNFGSSEKIIIPHSITPLAPQQGANDPFGISPIGPRLYEV